MARYLLDTNLLVGFVRGAPWAARAYNQFKLGDAETIVLTSDICRGELLSLAEQFGWGSGKREKMTEALNQYSSVGIEHASVQEAYAVIDNWTHGRSKSRPAGSVQPLSSTWGQSPHRHIRLPPTAASHSPLQIRMGGARWIPWIPLHHDLPPLPPATAWLGLPIRDDPGPGAARGAVGLARRFRTRGALITGRSIVRPWNSWSNNTFDAQARLIYHRA